MNEFLYVVVEYEDEAPKTWVVCDTCDILPLIQTEGEKAEAVKIFIDKSQAMKYSTKLRRKAQKG